MASAKQIAWRKKFAKLYGKKKTGSKSTKSKGSKKTEYPFKPIHSSKLRKGTISHTMAIKAEKQYAKTKEMLESRLNSVENFIATERVGLTTDKKEMDSMRQLRKKLKKAIKDYNSGKISTNPTEESN